MTDNFNMKQFLMENKLGAYSRIKEANEDKVPLNDKVKKFIDKAIADAKADDEFENLVDADWFDNELIDELIDLFPDEDYDSASKEVKDYISSKINMSEAKEKLDEYSDENYDIFMDGVLDVLVKDKIITKADVDALNRGGADDLMDALHDGWEGFENYKETGQAISTSDLNLAARAVAKKIGKLKEDLSKDRKIEGITEKISPEAIDRLEGLANIQDLVALKAKLRILTSDWMQEGFEKEDVVEYLKYLVNEI